VKFYYLILAFLFLSGCQMPPQPGDYRHNEDTLSVVSIRYALSVGNAGSETVEIPGALRNPDSNGYPCPLNDGSDNPPLPCTNCN
jgi:hypothetical protein